MPKKTKESFKEPENTIMSTLDRAYEIGYFDGVASCTNVIENMCDAYKDKPADILLECIRKALKKYGKTAEEALDEFKNHEKKGKENGKTDTKE